MGFFNWNKITSDKPSQIELFVGRVYKILPIYEHALRLYTSGYSQGNPYTGLSNYLYKIYIESIGIEGRSTHYQDIEMEQVSNSLYGLYRVFNEFDDSKKLTGHKDIKTIVFGIISMVQEPSKNIAKLR